MKDNTIEGTAYAVVDEAPFVQVSEEEPMQETITVDFNPIYKGEGIPNKRFGNNHKKTVKYIARKKGKVQKQARKLNRRK